MKKVFAFILTLVMLHVIAACESSNETYDIVTTLFPQYDMARAIAGDDLTVHNILPFATSPHSYEITSSDRTMIENASLFIYTSDELEVWASALSLSNTTILNLELESEAHGEEEHEHLEEEHEHDEEEHEHDDEDHDHDHADVHYWTNPHTMRDMVHVILEHMILIKPELENTFVERADVYLETLSQLDTDLNTFLASYSDIDLELYIAGHNAMSEFGEYYGLEIIALFPEFIPDAELSSLELSTFTTELIERDIKAFFIEPVFDNEPLAAKAIQSELNAQDKTSSYYELHQFHNISSTDAMNNMTLFDIFEQNIQNIKTVIELNYGPRT